MKREAFNGSITAFLSIIFLLIVSFIGGILESASIQVSKNERYANMQLAMESVFAEYQKELLEEYNVFALEGSYESAAFSESRILERLKYYGAGAGEQKIEKQKLLTDENGKEFYRQAVAYMKEKYSVSDFPDITLGEEKWEEEFEQAEDYAAEEQKQQETLDDLLAENEASIPEEENPLVNIGEIRKGGLLRVVLPKGRELSGRKVLSRELPSGRELKNGFGDFEHVEETQGLEAKPLFVKYIADHFSHAAKEEADGALAYEMEYLLGGKESDADNLEHVASKLLAIRFIPNYTYLLSDSAKQAEAEAMALTLCSVLAVPAITKAVKHLLLFSWAFGECVIDLRSLLAGNKVPLIKGKETWQLQLSSLLTLGTETDCMEGMDAKEGMSYEEYLKVLLQLEKKEVLAMRALDLIEADIRGRMGEAYFRVDNCITKLEVGSSCKLRRGIRYTFSTYYGYES